MKYLIWAAACISMAVCSPLAAQNLVHDYHFNGNANDSVGGANGTVIGNVTFETDPNSLGSNGNAVFAGGTTFNDPGFISLPTSAVSALQNATVEIFTTGFNTPNNNYGAPGGLFQSLFGVATPAGDTRNYTILSANRAGQGVGTGARTDFGGETVISGPDPLQDGNGVHITDLVYSGFTGVGSLGQESIYEDGLLIAQGSTVFSFADIASAPGGIAVVGIGGGSPYNDPTFSGSMDEVRIFADALNQDQISADVNFGPSDLGFVPVPEPSGRATGLAAILVLGAATFWPHLRKRIFS